jgi:multidrug efflux pump subunit AcrA (membrane-fusion protein)
MWPLALAIAGVGMLAWSGWHLASGPAEETWEEEADVDSPPRDLLVGEHFQKVVAKEIDVYQEFKGRVQGEGTIEIRAPQGMRVPVIKIHHEHGDFVDAGDPLLTLAGEQVEKALAEAREAGDEEKIARFESYLDHVVIKAPVDAQVLEIWCDPGNVPVDQGIPLMTLADRSSFSFVVLLPEDVMRSSAAIGTRLEIELAHGIGKVMGTVTSLGETTQGRMDTIGGHVNVILGLEEHEGLERDLAGVVRVPASKQIAGLIPKKAVEWRGDTPVVRVFEDGEVLERTVRLDGEEGERYVVLYGVNVGESVVVPGPAQ